MTRDDIIRMAKKAELHCHMNLTEHSLAIEDLEHFAALVRDDYSYKHASLWLTRIDEAVKAEREEIASEFEKLHESVKHLNNYWLHAAKYVMARGNT